MVYTRNFLIPKPPPVGQFRPMTIGKPLTNPYEAFIELDERIYNPGDIITGKLHLELKKKLTCDVINIRLFGSVRVFFVKSLTSSTPGVLSKNKAFEQEIVLIDKEINVWEAPTPEGGEERVEVTLDDIARMARSTSIRAHLPKAGKLPGFELGIYDFTFSFQLPPTGLYTSFDSKNSAGCIRYYVLMQAVNRGYTVLRKKHLFPVVTPVKLNDDLRAFETPKVSSTHTVGKGSVTATMELNKRGYVPGEPLSGKITICNNSKESVKYALLRIIQTSNCYSLRPEVEVKVTQFEAAGMGLPVSKIAANSTYSYNIDYYVSALVPNFNVEACLNVEYSLALSVGFVRNSPKNAFIELNIPIIIGTHPASNEAVLPKYVDMAPPPYLSHGYENIGFAPPTYEMAIGGRSEVTEEDDEDYSPLLYTYNFNQVRPKVE